MQRSYRGRGTAASRREGVAVPGCGRPWLHTRARSRVTLAADALQQSARHGVHPRADDRRCAHTMRVIPLAGEAVPDPVPRCEREHDRR